MRSRSRSKSISIRSIPTLAAKSPSTKSQSGSRCALQLRQAMKERAPKLTRRLRHPRSRHCLRLVNTTGPRLLRISLGRTITLTLTRNSPRMRSRSRSKSISLMSIPTRAAKSPSTKSQSGSRCALQLRQAIKERAPQLTRRLRHPQSEFSEGK